MLFYGCNVLYYDCKRLYCTDFPKERNFPFMKTPQKKAIMILKFIETIILQS